MKIAIISAVLPYHGGMGRVLDAEANNCIKIILILQFLCLIMVKIDVPYHVEY